MGHRLPSQGVQVVVVAFIFTFLAIAALGLRLWSRRLQGMTLAFNDYMAILSAVFATAATSVCIARKIPSLRTVAAPLICMLLEVFIGAVGVHAATLQATRPWILARYIRLVISGQILWAAANTSVKLSILSLYTTIFPTKKFSRVCYATMAASAAYFIGVFLGTMLSCRPVQYNWDKSIPHGRCPPGNAGFLLTAILNLALDAFILSLTIPKVSALRIPLARRVAIGAMFSLGAIICIISLLRTISVMTWNRADPTYTGAIVTIYSMLEPTLGVVNACLPTTRPALGRLFRNRHLFSRSLKSLQSSNVSKGHENGHSPTSPRMPPHQFELLEAGATVMTIHAANNQQGPSPLRD